jgi:hypothetical protein
VPSVFPEHHEGNVQRALSCGNSQLLAHEESGDPKGL